MFKKVGIVVLFFLCIDFVYAVPTLKEVSKATNEIEELKKGPPTVENANKIKELQKIIDDFKDYTNKDSIASSYYSINVDEIAPAKHIQGGNTKEVTNKLLGTIIQSLMIPLGAIALLIMTIGAGYMIFYHGQDELLSKGKSIFNSGLIALIVALSSYYIVSLVRFILYSTH